MPYASAMSIRFMLEDEEVRMERRLATIRANHTSYAGTLDTINGRTVKNSASAVRGLYR